MFSHLRRIGRFRYSPLITSVTSLIVCVQIFTASLHPASLVKYPGPYRSLTFFSCSLCVPQRTPCQVLCSTDSTHLRVPPLLRPHLQRPETWEPSYRPTRIHSGWSSIPIPFPMLRAFVWSIKFHVFRLLFTEWQVTLCFTVFNIKCWPTCVSFYVLYVLPSNIGCASMILCGVKMWKESPYNLSFVTMHVCRTHPFATDYSKCTFRNVLSLIG